MHARILALLLTLIAAAAAPVGPAAAAPPANDDRADAATLELDATARGTLRDASVQSGEPEECSGVEASVWYRFKPRADRDHVVQFDAGGDLDAAVTVFERVRSRLRYEDCELSDRRGQATLELGRLDPDSEYLIQVGQQRGSEPADFTLGVLLANLPARPPGAALPPTGARDSVDRLLNPSDAFNVRLVEGVTYRVSLTSRTCLGLAVFAPGTRSFVRDDPARSSGCGRYGVFTPERSGRHFLVVEAARGRGAQRYRLRMAPAGTDDTTPGRFIRNDVRVRGHVNGRIDSVDLYRFDVARPSTLTLRVSGGPGLDLLRDDGRRLDSGELIEARTRPGRYYAVVSGRGSYTLRRISRVTTRSTTRFNGRARTRVSPGTSVTLALNVRPEASGPGVIVVERKDPIAGWQFLRRYRVQVVRGRAAVSFVPPSVGRYRAASVYLGSRVASRSQTKLVKLRVAGPLVE